MARNQASRRLTHFDTRGAAHMVDVGAKRATRRVA
ncbi:MAG: cyclic pyranopterin monophosphate synthase MoaC, partial [bacterium]